MVKTMGNLSASIEDMGPKKKIDFQLPGQIAYRRVYVRNVQFNVWDPARKIAAKQGKILHENTKSVVMGCLQWALIAG